MKEKDINSLDHTTWRCQYHIVFAPKFRRMVIFKEIQADIGKILRQLCQQKGVEIIEAWQVRAETSLFYRKYGSYETKADGMILICDDDKRDKIAENIIRQTMWSRKTLLKERYAETNKPLRYSRSPIKLRTQYRRVYLTTPSRLFVSLQRIYEEDEIIASTIPDAEICYDRSCGDVQVWPMWYYINPACDLLKFVYFFSEAKSSLKTRDDDLCYVPKIEFTIILHQEDQRILQMYPDVLQSERVNVLVYQSTKNTESN